MTLSNNTLLSYRILTSFLSASKCISLYPTIYIYVCCSKSPLNWSYPTIISELNKIFDMYFIFTQHPSFIPFENYTLKGSTLLQWFEETMGKEKMNKHMSKST